jgi:hypothetical protein
MLRRCLSVEGRCCFDVSFVPQGEVRIRTVSSWRPIDKSGTTSIAEFAVLPIRQHPEHPR